MSLPDDISWTTLVTFFSHKSVGASLRARFDANFSVTARPSELANYRRYNNASPGPIKSNDSFRAMLVGLSVSGVGGGIVLATKQQQRAVRQGRFT